MWAKSGGKLVLNLKKSNNIRIKKKTIKKQLRKEQRTKIWIISLATYVGAAKKLNDFFGGVLVFSLAKKKH